MLLIQGGYLGLVAVLSSPKILVDMGGRRKGKERSLSPSSFSKGNSVDQAHGGVIFQACWMWTNLLSVGDQAVGGKGTIPHCSLAVMSVRWGDVMFWPRGTDAEHFTQYQMFYTFRRGWGEINTLSKK